MTTIPLAKDNTFLIGHENAEQIFLKAYQSQNLHHAWLLCGPIGIGKSTLAYKIARFLCATDEQLSQNLQTLDVSPSNPVVAQIASRSCPNFMAIERDYTETDKKKIIKAIKDGDPLDDEALSGLKKSSVIKVDDVREVHSFLSKKSFDGKWRVVLIDSIDELNQASSNAILKILEEPPLKSILLLVCHNPNKILPTILSRCSRLYLNPLSQENVATLLRRYAPELCEKDILELALISQGSIGRALTYAKYGGLNIYQKLQSVFYAGDNFNLKTALSLATEGATDDNLFSLTIDLILQFVVQMSREPKYAENFARMYAAVVALERETIALNMDKKHILLNIFNMIASEVKKC